MGKPDKVTIKDLMVKNIVTVESSESLQEVAKKLYANRVGSAIVLEDEKPVGIITNRDIVSIIGSFKISLDDPAKKNNVNTNNSCWS